MEDEIREAIFDSCIDILKTYGPQDTQDFGEILEAQYGIYIKDDTKHGFESRYEIPPAVINRVLDSTDMTRKVEGTWKLIESEPEDND